MTNLAMQKGSCLCGSITITTTSMNPAVGVCHCGMCRKWGAGPFLSVNCNQDIEIEGEDNLGIYNSSDWGERGFCKQCGSNLFYRLKKTSTYYVSSEIFEEAPLKMELEIFIDCKPEYYSFCNETKKMTEKEVFESYS